ncbi:hypothetical protein OHA09_20200 [Streptomyces longwoodensis]|uniref:hypothetical protein n=1 Tax=Streptomyces longwoodensis TaxID=68231 RepID=UPI002252C53C|nr:hypothetical protein [Streptomyces longwoodensis]MCX4994412.1 hypothetical protein [Streptomyces longwoodensis]WUC59244.1 hypothetical protein OHA09_20200 [Streptomyces longwoodensis]
MSDRTEQWTAILSLAFPVLAFLWEFAVVGRKRLGYRVQMDTLAADAAGKPYADVLGDMRHDGHQLKDPSFVLLRIENAGSAKIGSEDYLADPVDPYGIKVTFRDRRVAAVVLTDPSRDEVRGRLRRGGLPHLPHPAERQGRPARARPRPVLGGARRGGVPPGLTGTAHPGLRYRRPVRVSAHPRRRGLRWGSRATRSSTST